MWRTHHSTFTLSLYSFFFVRTRLSIQSTPFTSLLDAADTAVFQLPYQESKLITWIVKSTLLLRAFFIRHFMLPRSTWLNRTPFYAYEKNRFVPELFIYKPHIYKEGYVISELGPNLSSNVHSKYGLKKQVFFYCK